MLRRSKPLPGNKRGGRRLPAILRVEYSCGGGLHAGYAANISEGGLFLQCADALPPGQRLHLRVALPGAGEVTAIGQIAWAAPNGGPTLMPGVGVQFQQVNDVGRVLLQRFINEFSA